MKTPFLQLWAAAFFVGTVSVQAEWRAPLESKQMTNGTETLAPLAALEGQLQSCTALLLNKKGKAVATATWVGKEGYFLTKASEVPRLEECTLKRAGATDANIREIRRDTQHDLVLAQAIQVQGVTPVRFDNSKDLTFGQWLASPTLAKDLKIGVVSAQRRMITGFGAAIGIRMEDKVPGEAGGVRIIGVAEDSPAASAGLKTNDIMLELAGETVSEYRRVNEIISKRQPGEEIIVKFKRGGKEDQLHVRLASRTKVLANWDGEDFANGGISIRTDNFTEVLQHDVPLGPADMGGPLLDLNGRAVGLNIARVDRVTTFALPGELFWPMVQKWIKADRNPPKAVPAQLVKSKKKDTGKNESSQKPRG
jgi:serine protease Do